MEISAFEAADSPWDFFISSNSEKNKIMYKIL